MCEVSIFKSYTTIIMPLYELLYKILLEQFNKLRF